MQAIDNLNAVCYIQFVPTEERIARVEQILSTRQSDLRVVLEGVTIPHNASAVMRTCDAAGVVYLDLISPNPELLNFNDSITTGAHKWLEIEIHSSPADCLSKLKEKGMTVAATSLGKDSLPYTEFDFTRPTALVFGNESEGLSREALALADVVIQIPMLGMVQSLNLSVSAAVILFEAVRQREKAGFFSSPRLEPEELDLLRRKWLRLPADE